MKNTEQRSISGVEVRVEGGDGGGGPTKIVGYAAKFGVRSELIGGVFREIIAPGAFGAELPGADVRFLVNHDPSQLLARTKSGTLRLSEDDVGLRFEAMIPETSIGRDVLEQVRRGDLDSTSFGFRKIADDWTKTEEGVPLRTLRRLSIFDVSLATFPAYPDTEVALRSLSESKGQPSENVGQFDGGPERREFDPNDAMKEEAARGLAWREEYGRGGTEIGVARARDISNGRGLSLETVYRMRSYFARHEVDKQGAGWSQGEEGYPSAGRIAWALWGGDPGRTWAEAIVEREEAAEEEGGSRSFGGLAVRNLRLRLATASGGIIRRP